MKNIKIVSCRKQKYELIQQLTEREQNIDSFMYVNALCIKKAHTYILSPEEIVR